MLTMAVVKKQVPQCFMLTMAVVKKQVPQCFILTVVVVKNRSLSALYLLWQS